MQCNSQCTSQCTALGVGRGGNLQYFTAFHWTQRNAVLQCSSPVASVLHFICKKCIALHTAADFNATSWHDWWLQFIWSCVVGYNNSNDGWLQLMVDWLEQAACNPTLLHRSSLQLMCCCCCIFVTALQSEQCTVGNPILERSLHCFGHFFTPRRWSVLGFAPPAIIGRKKWEWGWAGSYRWQFS